MHCAPGSFRLRHLMPWQNYIFIMIGKEARVRPDHCQNGIQNAGRILVSLNSIILNTTSPASNDLIKFVLYQGVNIEYTTKCLNKSASRFRLWWEAYKFWVIANHKNSLFPQSCTQMPCECVSRKVYGVRCQNAEHKLLVYCIMCTQMNVKR